MGHMEDDQSTDCGSGEPARCEEALEELYHLLDGELTEDVRARIVEHLDACAPCAEPYDFYAELRRLVQQRCRDQAPPSLLTRVQAAIEAEAASRTGGD
jgi:mycothiol system anti-sigma-R factor